MDQESFLVRPLTDHEKLALREFASQTVGISQIISLAIANEIKKMDSLDSIDTDRDPRKISEEVVANKRARNTLIDIFNELGFSMIGEKIRNNLNIRKNRPR